MTLCQLLEHNGTSNQKRKQLELLIKNKSQHHELSLKMIWAFKFHFYCKNSMYVYLFQWT